VLWTGVLPPCGGVWCRATDEEKSAAARTSCARRVNLFWVFPPVLLEVEKGALKEG
jgi:hypothetical protein